jgi:hypothetical protein
MTIQNSDDYIEDKLKEENGGLDLKRLEALRKKKKVNQDVLNKNIRKILLFSGFIGASISGVAYLVATFVMIKGVSANLTLENQILFSILGAIIGILISTLLRSQGINYAKQNPEVKEIMRNYTTAKNNAIVKDKKLHMIGWYMFWALIVDIFIKGFSVAISTFLIVYVFVKGSGDWSLLWLAVSNIGLFTGFGLVSLSMIYEKYIEHHLPAVIQRTIRLEKEALKKVEAEEKEKERLLQIEKDKIKAKAKAKRKPATKKKPKKKPKKKKGETK